METSHDIGTWVTDVSSWTMSGHFKHAIKRRDNFKVHSYIRQTNQPTYVLHYLCHSQTVNLIRIYILTESMKYYLPRNVVETY
jgi:hypothetical protein